MPDAFDAASTYMNNPNLRKPMQFDWESLLGGVGKINPLLNAGMSGLGILADLWGNNAQNDYYETQNKIAKWIQEQRSRYMDELKGMKIDPRGIGEGDITRDMSLVRTAMKPQMDRAAFGMSRGAGVGSPQVQQALMAKVAELLAGEELGMRREGRQRGFEDKWRKFSSIADLLR